jgi:DNA-binding transcriptional regulator YhcF (GntR family)
MNELDLTQFDPSLGFVPFHRCWLAQTNPRARDPHWVALWACLLGSASHRPRSGIFEGKRVTLKPGQLITGRHKLAADTGIHPSKVFRLLEKMKSDQLIEQQSGVKSSIITVIPWHLLHPREQQTEQREDSKRAAVEQQPSTIQQLDNGTGKQKTRKTGARSLAPDALVPSTLEEVFEYARANGIETQILHRWLCINNNNGWRIKRSWKGALRAFANEAHLGVGYVPKNWIPEIVRA